ncbi:MAG: hypothetical protein NT099_05955, partial [Candidatus Saganbacteria bacterium]|nr:hypothetical protein [Candidatus Saganbacteria bacterium]
MQIDKQVLVGQLRERMQRVSAPFAGRMVQVGHAGVPAPAVAVAERQHLAAVTQNDVPAIAGAKVAEVEALLPKGTEISVAVKVVVSRWIGAEKAFEEANRFIQDAINQGADQETIDAVATAARAELEALQGQFYEAYNSLEYVDAVNLKKVLHVYQILKYTPEGVQKQEEMKKYATWGEDGQWHLKPEAMEITITAEMLDAYSADNPNGHNIASVIDHKGKKYAISTAGYRDNQNTHFPWDGNSNFGFFEEAITAYSQNLTLALMASRKDADLQADVAGLKGLVASYRQAHGVAADVKDSAVLAEILNNGGAEKKEALRLFSSVCGRLEKLAGGEVRFNTDMYQELFVRIAAAMGVTIHTPVLEGLNKTSIWMASFLIFTGDLDMGNFLTSSHAMAKYGCSKDLSDEGAQFLPEVSVSFAAVNKWVVDQIRAQGSFTIKVAATDDAHIKRDVDGKPEYLAMLRTSVLTPANEALIHRAIAEKGYRIVQDCVAGCMGPIMKALYAMARISEAVTQLNPDYDPFQAGIGKAVVKRTAKLLDGKFAVRATLPKLVYDDEGCDASLQVVVERMYYKHLLKDAPIGQVVTNTDPDGDRLVVGQIMANDAATKARLGQFGIKYIEIDEGKLFCYYSPNKMFLMTTAYYLNQLVSSGEVKKGDTAVVMKTAQTSYAFNEFCVAFERKTGVRVVCVEPTVGFKEIAAAQRKIEAQILANKERAEAGEALQDVVVTDALGHTHNLGTGNIKLVTASEESGGQELAPPIGMTSAKGRFALGNREKSAGVASFLAIVFGADLCLKGQTVLDYWDGLIAEYGLKFVQDERHDERLFDPGIPDPVEYKAAERRGNEVKLLNNSFWWNLARAYEEGALSLDRVKEILVATFPTIDPTKLNTLVEIKPVLCAGDRPSDQAKDGAYLLFGDFYIAIRPSGTDPKIKGYYSGKFDPNEGIQIAKAMAGYVPGATPEWQAVNYYETDPYA